MHVDRVAADVVGRGVQRQIRRAPHVLEQDVADVHVGQVDAQHVPARAGGILRSNHDVPRQVPDVRQEIQHAVQIAGAEVVVLQRGVERERSAVRRNGLHGPLFPLVDGVDPAASGDFALLDVPGIRQDESVADLPAGDRRRQRQRGVARARLGREAQERRRPHAAVHRHFAEHVDPRPELIRVRDAAAERRIGDDDLGRHVGGDRRGSGADFEDSRRAHPHVRRP